jgi:hypothetical protein
MIDTKDVSIFNMLFSLYNINNRLELFLNPESQTNSQYKNIHFILLTMSLSVSISPRNPYLSQPVIPGFT